MKKIDSMNLVPFIDIMLVLLVIVLTTASFINTSKLPINIPKVDKSSSQDNQVDKKQVNISITNDGKYYLDDKPVSFESLKNQISSFSKNSSIILHGDKNSDLNSFIQVLDLLQANGLNQIYILVQDNKK